MGYIVILTEKKDAAALNAVTRDEQVSRQSITAKDGAALGLKEGFQYLLIEGSDSVIDRARDLAAEHGAGTILDGDDAEQVYKKLKEEEASAASGVGMIFD